MTVAWIGNRDTLVQDAVSRAAEFLAASWCPVISLDTDIHGTRAAIALARRVGAAYDSADSVALARETALLNGRGGMFTTVGEVLRRADVVVIVGELPPAHHAFVARLAESVPDLGSSNAREIFMLYGDKGQSVPRKPQIPATLLSCETGGLAGTLASLRAQIAGRRVLAPAVNFQRFAGSLEQARFTAFLCSGAGTHQLELEMLQGLIADANKKSRASALMLPANEAGWGASLASSWMTGFPMRTSFSRGVAEYDPWRWDVSRMIEEGETDLHLWIGSGQNGPPVRRPGIDLIALTRTDEPVPEAAVTIPVGAPGSDHDAVVYCSRRGTFAGINAEMPTQLPSAASVIAAIAEHLPNQMEA